MAAHLRLSFLGARAVRRPTARAIALCRAADELVVLGLGPAALELYEHAGRELAPAARAQGDGEMLTEERLARARSGVVAGIAGALAEERRRLGFGTARARRFVLGVLVLALGLWLARLACFACYVGDVSAGARWTASSASEGAALTGKFPQRGLFFVEPKFFFHTRSLPESFVRLDLGRVRTLSRIEVVNRLDCCFERAANLEVAISRDGKRFRTVASRKEPAAIERLWTIPTSRRARFVRVTSHRAQPLHLADLRVFGR